MAISVVVLAASGGSYLYHSSAAASTFMSRAEAAAAKNDYAEQAKWLRQYSLLNPDDVDVLCDVALAADAAAAVAEFNQKPKAIVNARGLLALAVVRLSSLPAEDRADNEVRLKDLRGRLIERLLQMGPDWASEAERHVVALEANPSDAEAIDWLAHALFLQVSAGRYRERLVDLIDSDAGPESLADVANQPPGNVMLRAVDLNPENVDTIARFLSLYGSEPGSFGEQGVCRGCRARESLFDGVEQRLGQPQ